jgi:hypothetical protein
MYWGEELVAIYNEAYIGMHTKFCNARPTNASQVLLARNILP